MRNKILFVFCILCSLTAFGQKKIALLETLNGDKTVKVEGIEMNMVRGELRKAICLHDGFRAFTRTDIDQLMKEYGFQNSGMVSDEQRKQVGKMSGADYICVSTLTKRNTQFYLEAYLIEVTTGEISHPATQYGMLKDGSYANLFQLCRDLAQELIGNIGGGTNVNTTYQQYGTKTTSNGLVYKFLEVNKSGQRAQVGDVLVGELLIRFEDDTLFSNVGNPDRIFQVAENSMFKGDIQEGLLMLHIGDKAVFNIPADSVANLMQSGQMPPKYEQGKGQFFYYEISLMDIVTKDELAREQVNYVEEMEQRKNSESTVLAQYITDNNITTMPTESGLYVIVKRKGYGPKVDIGKTVSVNYTGRLLDGTLFDTSREADARKAGEYIEGRAYEPLTYVVGEQPMIKGWDEGVMSQSEGTILQLIIPSALGYGSRGAGKNIPPYSPLVFDIEIITVDTDAEVAE